MMAVLMRGSKKFKEDLVRDGDTRIAVRHMEPIKWGVDVKPEDEVRCFMEVFERSLTHACPHCQYVVFNSTNYMMGPEWFYKMEREKEERKLAMALSGPMRW